jgi:predicted NUDIX family phosphoesterase
MEMNQNKQLLALDISEVEVLAQKVFNLKMNNSIRQRRPLFVEFCGSPKSGKSSTINALNLFLKRNKFKTALLSERASVCPIKDKTQPFFNVWTACSTISEIVKNLSFNADYHDLDVILSDRGLIDSLFWFNWLKNSRLLRTDDYSVIKNFLTTPLLIRYVDLVFVFKSSPDVSMDREYANLLTGKEGSIMNRKVLTQYNQSIDEILVEIERMEGHKSRKIEYINTDSYDQRQVNKIVTVKVLNNFEEILIEKIGYLNKSIREFLYRGMRSYYNSSPFLGSLGNINPPQPNQNGNGEIFTLEFDFRENVENSENIQPVPIAVITNEEKTKVLVVQKKSQSLGPDSPEFNKSLLYVGGHIRKEDDTSWDFFQISKNAIERELEEEVGVPIKIERYIDIPYLIYDDSDPRSRKHLAICYIGITDFEKTFFRVDNRELTINQEFQGSNGVVELSTLKTMLMKNVILLESWSLNILKTIFKIEIDNL